MKVLILGVTGMLGSEVFLHLKESSQYIVHGTVRKMLPASHLMKYSDTIISGVEASNLKKIKQIIEEGKYNTVINCIGAIKQKSNNEDPINYLTYNAILPHELSKICDSCGSRLILISTDCVFSGKGSLYTEQDFADARDYYGVSKYLGEISNKKHVLTLRTSIIGHEISSSSSLLEWFKSQTGTVDGYTNAYFSGLTTGFLSEVIGTLCIPDLDLYGLYHVASNRISKYELLCKLRDVYGLTVGIDKFEQFKIDRSLNCDSFGRRTGYRKKNWTDQLINTREKYVRRLGNA